MSTTQLRKQVVKRVTELPASRLQSAADYLDYLDYLAGQRRLKRIVAQSEREHAAGKSVSWRAVRRDV